MAIGRYYGTPFGTSAYPLGSELAIPAVSTLTALYEWEVGQGDRPLGIVVVNIQP